MPIEELPPPDDRERQREPDDARPDWDPIFERLAGLGIAEVAEEWKADILRDADERFRQFCAQETRGDAHTRAIVEVANAWLGTLHGWPEFLAQARKVCSSCTPDALHREVMARYWPSRGFGVRHAAAMQSARTHVLQELLLAPAAERIRAEPAEEYPAELAVLAGRQLDRLIRDRPELGRLGDETQMRKAFLRDVRSYYRQIRSLWVHNPSGVLTQAIERETVDLLARIPPLKAESKVRKKKGA
jgi:hypothetical protein